MPFRLLFKDHGFPALKVALVVGSILILINQYQAVVGDEPLKIVPAVATYCVPFIVFLLGRRKER